jgi:outer membrane protease
MNGTAFERVWVGDYKMSELEWELDRLWMAGVQGTFGLMNRLRLNAGLWTALNEGDGRMVDRDWAYFSPSGRLTFSPDPSDDQWTHQSIHPDTSVDGAASFDVNLDLRVFTAGAVSFSGILGYRLDRFRWSSRGGDYVYSTAAPFLLRDRIGSFPDGELVIEYEQRYDIPYFGAGLEGNFGRLLLQARLLYSPWAAAWDEDYHVLRDILFAGDFSGGGYLALGLSGSWKLRDSLLAALSFDYQKIDDFKGDVAITFPGESPVIDDMGASVEMSSLTLSFLIGWQFATGR